MVLHERHLRRLLTNDIRYDHHWRTHRAREMDCPMPRSVQRPELGRIWEVPDWVGCITTMSGERRDDTGANLPVDGCDGFSGLTEAKQGQDAQLRAFAAQTLPTLQEHLQTAWDLAAKYQMRIGKRGNTGERRSAR